MVASSGSSRASFGIGVGQGEVTALEESGDGLGVVSVALGFAAVDGFHGPGVSEGEGEVVIAAEVGQPVPAVHALAADYDSVAEGRNGVEEGFGGDAEVTAEEGLSVVVEDDEEEGPGVQIDSGVESDVGGRLEETHGKASGKGDAKGGGKSPLPSSQARAFMSIQALQPAAGHANDPSAYFDAGAA
jgi:hypothetical protein